MGRARDSAGQLWRFHPVKGGLFRITNKQVGEGMGLDIGREEGNAPVMAPTSDPRGQLWKITLSADGGWHLTNQVLGKGRALDTYSDGANAPFMGETGDILARSGSSKPKATSGRPWSPNQPPLPRAGVPRPRRRAQQTTSNSPPAKGRAPRRARRRRPVPAPPNPRRRTRGLPNRPMGRNSSLARQRWVASNTTRLRYLGPRGAIRLHQLVVCQRERGREWGLAGALDRPRRRRRFSTWMPLISTSR